MIHLIERECPECGNQFLMCRSCYRGHVYCSKECSIAARKKSQRKSQRKYRKKDEIKKIHRERERRKTLVNEKGNSVGYQGSPGSNDGPDCDLNEASKPVETRESTIEPGEDSRELQCESNTGHCCRCGRKGFIVESFPRRPTGRSWPKGPLVPEEFFANRSIQCMI